MFDRSKSRAAGAAAGALALLFAGLILLDVGRAQSPGSEKELFEKRCGGCHALDATRKARNFTACTAVRRRPWNHFSIPMR